MANTAVQAIIVIRRLEETKTLSFTSSNSIPYLSTAFGIKPNPILSDTFALNNDVKHLDCNTG
jgi:hypothetical protein